MADIGLVQPTTEVHVHGGEAEFYKELGTEVKTGMKIGGWITSHTVSRKFQIRGYELRKLRDELKGTHHMKEGTGGLWLFSLEYMRNRFHLKEQIPQRLVIYE